MRAPLPFEKCHHPRRPNQDQSHRCQEATAWSEKYFFISTPETAAEQDKAFAAADRDSNGELSFEVTTTVHC